MNQTHASYQKSYDKNCFREHISESIKINKERKKFYREMTNGESDKIFNKLIAYEHLTLIPALAFDLKAVSYQENGMELFCHEFMSLNKIPTFNPMDRNYPDRRITPFRLDYYKHLIKEAVKSENVEEIRRVAINGLKELKKQSHYYCFTRHFLESIYRFAYFIPQRKSEAKSLGLKDPTHLMLNVIKLHLLGLKDCYSIDQWAAPIQLKGIPILCSEVPDLLEDLNHAELNELKNF